MYISDDLFSDEIFTCTFLSLVPESNSCDGSDLSSAFTVDWEHHSTEAARGWQGTRP